MVVLAVRNVTGSVIAGPEAYAFTVIAWLLVVIVILVRFSVLALILSSSLALAFPLRHDLCHDLGEGIGLSKVGTVIVVAVPKCFLLLSPALRSRAWRLAHDIDRVRPLQRPSARFDGLERLHHVVSFPPSLRFTMDQAPVFLV